MAQTAAATPRSPSPDELGADALWRARAKNELEINRYDLETAIEAEKTEIDSEIAGDTRAFYPPHGIVYSGLVVAYLALHVALASGTLAFLGEPIHPLGIPVNLSYVVFPLQVLHLALSFRSVKVSELAGFLAFSRPIYSPNAGLYIVPFGLMEVISVGRNYQDVRFPGPADFIYRVSEELQQTTPGGDVPPADKPWLVRPIYVTTGEPRLSPTEVEERKKDDARFNPLDLQLNVEIAYFLRFRANQGQGGVFRIARNLSADSGDLNKRIEDLIREQSERDISVVLSRHTPATIIENRGLVNEVFLLTTRLAVMRLGIDVAGGGLDDMNPSHKTNEAQANVTRALFAKLKTITDAEARREEQTLHGQGAANAVRSGLEALGEGYAKIMADAKVDGSVVIGSETLKHALPDTTFVAGTGGIEQMLGIAAAAASFFKKADGANDSTPNQNGGA